MSLVCNLGAVIVRIDRLEGLLKKYSLHFQYTNKMEAMNSNVEEYRLHCIVLCSYRLLKSIWFSNNNGRRKLYLCTPRLGYFLFNYWYLLALTLLGAVEYTR